MPQFLNLYNRENLPISNNLVLYLPIGVIRIVNPKVFSKILSDPKLLGLKKDLNH
jgi:hypothetical protein